MLHTPRLFLAAALAGSTLLMSGCLISSSNRNFESGTLVTRGTLQQLTPGETDKATVIAALGEPRSRKDLGDGAELWRWEHTHRRRSSGTVLFLFASVSENETTTSTYVMFRDGVVERAWQD